MKKTDYQWFMEMLRNKKAFGKKYGYRVDEIEYMASVMQNGAAYEDAQYSVKEYYKA